MKNILTIKPCSNTELLFIMTVIHNYVIIHYQVNFKGESKKALCASLLIYT